MNSIHLRLALCALVLSAGCDKTSDTTPVNIPSKGVIVINEGTYGSGNASLSVIDPNAGTIINDVFKTVNSFPLGDVAQSMAVYNGHGYVVVNNSQKVEVVNAQTMQVQATIQGFQGPRYFIARGAKGYVSDWFSNSVAVINLASSTITANIPTGEGPEQMVISGNRMFVANVGGWNTDSTLTVINLDSGTVDTTFATGIAPNSLCLDATGKLWVLCSGATGPDFQYGTSDDIGGSLRRMNPSTGATELALNMDAMTHPSKLHITADGTTLYFLSGSDGYNGKVVRMATSAQVLPSGFAINRSFYGLGIDPGSGTIYCGYAPGFTVRGYILRYKSSLALIDSLKAGIAPNGFCFR